MGKVFKALEKASFTDISATIAAGRQRISRSDRTVKVPPTIEGLADGHPQPGPYPAGWNERLLLSTQRDNVIADSFNRLRSKILHPEKGAPPRTILVTSVAPQEGKGFVCANLGVALAKGMRHHALVVDCDLRRPTLATLFGIENQPGLTDYLQGGADIGGLIKKTGMPKLSVIPSGPPPHNPAELLDSPSMIALLGELTKRYDDRFIIFDSPPNLVASETLILSKYIDGVILVIRWGKSDREEAKKMIGAIAPHKIIGVVFNGYEGNPIENLLSKKKYGGYYGDY